MTDKTTPDSPKPSVAPDRSPAHAGHVGEKSTQLIHHAYTPPPGFRSPVVGIYKASTVIFPDVQAMRARDWRDKRGYTYGLHGTPTTFTLEERIATLEGGQDTLLTPSGLSAITLVNLAMLRHGDEVLIPDNAYGPGKELARHELSAMGISHRFYDPMAGAGVRDWISERTRLLWIEAPGSVTMEFPDLMGLLRLAHDSGVPVALDNTWGAGLAFNPFALPDGQAVDISVHALTKYPSGGGDVLMGAVTTVDKTLHHRLKATHMRTGMGVGANDAEAVLRGLPSLTLRYHAQDQAARALARWLGEQPEVVQVLHPAMPGSPGHAHWRALCGCAAGLFSVVLDKRITQEEVDELLNGLRLFRLGYSWGGPISLAVPYQLQNMRQNPAWPGHVLRFSVGLEAVEDLRADLAQAMERALRTR